MILEDEKVKFLTILRRLNDKKGKGLTIKETAESLNISESKMKSFLKGNIFDYWLLKRYGDLLSENVFI